MSTKKILLLSFFLFIGFFAACFFFAYTFQKNTKNDPEPEVTARFETHYELPKLIPVVWYVGK